MSSDTPTTDAICKRICNDSPTMPIETQVTIGVVTKPLVEHARRLEAAMREAIEITEPHAAGVPAGHCDCRCCKAYRILAKALEVR